MKTNLSEYFATQKWLIPLRNFRVEAGQRVLDIGCGNGEVLGILENYGACAIGLDIEINRGLRESKSGQEASLSRDRVTPLVQSDARALPLRDASFDLVVSFLCLPHIYEEKRVLLEIRRVVKEGGRILIVLFNKSFLNLVIAIAIKMGIQELPYPLIRYHTQRGALRLFEQVGFQVDRIYTTDFHPPLIGSRTAGLLTKHDGLVRRLPLLRGQGRLLIVEASPRKNGDACNG